MVYRVYVEKKPDYDVEAQALKNELVSLLGITGLTGLRLLNRYDVEGVSQELFESCLNTVFRASRGCNLPHHAPAYRPRVRGGVPPRPV